MVILDVDCLGFCACTMLFVHSAQRYMISANVVEMECIDHSGFL